MKFIANLSKKTWTIKEADSLDSGKTLVSIGFTDGKKKVVFFDNLSFGATLKYEGGEMSQSFPEKDVFYESTDQEIVKNILFETIPNEKIDIFVWAENSGEFFSVERSTTTGMMQRPFPSWSWNKEDEKWEAPNPIPDDSGPYNWDEGVLAWKEVFLPLED